MREIGTSGAERTSRTLPEILAEHERFIIVEALVRCGGSRKLAAEFLGIQRRRFYRHVASLKIDLAAIEEVVARSGAAPRGRLPSRKLFEILAGHERLIIVEALARCGGSRSRAAAALGISRRRFYRRVVFLKIDLAEIEEAVARSGKNGGER